MMKKVEHNTDTLRKQTKASKRVGTVKTNQMEISECSYRRSKMKTSSEGLRSRLRQWGEESAFRTDANQLKENEKWRSKHSTTPVQSCQAQVVVLDSAGRS
jgi:hypothetical protein